MAEGEGRRGSIGVTMVDYTGVTGVFWRKVRIGRAETSVCAAQERKKEMFEFIDYSLNHKKANDQMILNGISLTMVSNCHNVGITSPQPPHRGLVSCTCA